MATEKLFKPKLILLDVYDTLLNMSEVRRRVDVLMNSRRGYLVWFDLFMQYCFVDNCIVQFNEFADIAKATMHMTADIFKRSIAEHDIHDVLELMKHLPLHEGVQEGLSLLSDHKFRIAALTNSPSRIVIDRMERTGLISYFEKVMSAEQVKKYKPSLAVYQWAAKSLDVPCEDMLLVSTHGWDLAGAANAKMKLAYIKQEQQMLYPLAPPPDFTANNLAELAEILCHH